MTATLKNLVRAQDETIIALTEMITILGPDRSKELIYARDLFMLQSISFKDFSELADDWTITVGDYISRQEEYADQQRIFIREQLKFLVGSEHFSGRG